ncbi:biotin/lipoate--protein ligase family protein [Methylobacterium currus]|uniref:biotin/lipoate--protein ligase family protein n=1 Tax=Methylobacterium currus TaxID=2051553 RepID=UPI001E4679DA|nr:biotin/lipoate--protein ligase family protein [Methylobacterium currus]UHC15972.1 biotin/lipoate--protein ligase family protein [Methylobacterium currus]
MRAGNAISLMTFADPSGLMLPPAFRPLRLTATAGTAHDRARALAEGDDEAAGTLVVGGRPGTVEVAVVLAPEEPLSVARLVGLVGLTALAEAVGSHAPPDKPVTLDAAGTLHFDRARLGGGRLAWPEGCAEDAVPGWLVFSAMLIASKREAGDPGHTPESTSLEEEGFETGADALVESFARHLLRGLALWAEDGPAAAVARARTTLDADPATLHLDGTGWFDPSRGGPRL